ncbi:MAG: LysM peptidoglycan-binding domain-containing protein, partial [Planctomycetota bacterium]
DDAAAAATGSTAYARDLLDLADQPGPALAAAGTVPVFHRPSEFFRRIQMLLQRDGRLSTSASRLRRLTQLLATGACVVAVAGLLGVPASAQDPEPGRNLRTQNERLRAEIEALRVELKELRDLIDQQRQGQQPGVPVLQDVPLLGQLFRDVPPSQDPLAALNQHTTSGATWDLFRMAWVSNSRAYEVEKGETFESIAKDELGSAGRADEIALLNPGVDPTTLRPGQKLNLPIRPLNWIRSNTLNPPVPSGPPPQDPTASPPPQSVPMFLPGEDGLPSRRVNLQLGDALLNDQLARARAEEGAQPSDRTLGASTTEAVAELTTRCLDLQAEVEVAEAEAEQVNALAKQGTASNLEAKRATTKLASLQRKLTIVRQLIDGEIKASEAELSWLERKMKEGDKTDRLRLEVQVQRARTRIQALKSAR